MFNDIHKMKIFIMQNELKKLQKNKTSTSFMQLVLRKLEIQQCEKTFKLIHTKPLNKVMKESLIFASY